MASLKFWDGTQWVVIASGAGDYVKRVGDLMSGPLVITDDGAENPTALLLQVAGTSILSSLETSAVGADDIRTGTMTIRDGAQPGYVWTATDGDGHGEWQSLSNITPGPAAVVISDTEPPFPLVGMQWWDTSKPDVMPFYVVANYLASGQVQVTPGAGWTDAPWATFVIDIPCEGLLTVDFNVQMHNTTANNVAAMRVVKKSESGLTASEFNVAVNGGQARVSGATGTGKFKQWGKTYLEITDVDPSGGSLELGFLLYTQTAAVSGFIYPEAHCRFDPYANERIVFLDLGEAP